MAIQPVVWAMFDPVADGIAMSEQSDTVALANGNTLVIWTEQGQTLAPQISFDIAGQYYDPRGEKITPGVMVIPWRRAASCSCSASRCSGTQIVTCVSRPRALSTET